MQRAFLAKIKPYPIKPKTLTVIQYLGKNIANQIKVLNLGISYSPKLEQLKDKLLIVNTKGASMIGVIKDKIILSEEETIFIPEDIAEQIHLTKKEIARVTIMGKAIISEQEQDKDYN